MTRNVFLGFPAFVGRIDGPTSCAFWAEKALFGKPASLIPVDLSKKPKNLAGAVLQVDDHRSDGTGALSSIGPMFPISGVGGTLGSVYLEENYYKSLLPIIKPTVPPAEFNARAYEFTTARYLDGVRIGKRYFGFHAVIVKEEPPTSNKLVAIYDAGTSMDTVKDSFGVVHGKDPAVTLWLDLDLLYVDAHTNDGGLTEIGQGKAEGALFVEWSFADFLKLNIAKMPRGEGTTTVPPVPR